MPVGRFLAYGISDVHFKGKIFGEIDPDSPSKITERRKFVPNVTRIFQEVGVAVIIERHQPCSVVEIYFCARDLQVLR